MTTLEVQSSLRLNAKQWAFVRFDPPPDNPIAIAAALGRYASGKTTGGGARFVRGVCLNAFVRGVHREGDPPRSGIISPSMTSLKQGPLTQIRRLVDQRMIRRIVLDGDEAGIYWANGHVTGFYSARSVLEGPNMVQIWADEIQHPSFAGKLHNIQARVRDERAKWLNCQVTGLPELGEVADVFRYPKTANRLTMIFRTADNLANLAKGYLDNLKGSFGADEFDEDPDGWATSTDAVFPRWSQRNLARAPDLESRRRVATSLAVDLGNRGAVVFGQPESVLINSSEGRAHEETGLLIVDQLLFEATAASDVAERIAREKKWSIVPGQSVICMDPTASLDEVNAFKRSFPGVEIVRHLHGPYHAAATGLRAVNRAILDGQHNVRLYVHPKLAGASKRGVPETMVRYSRSKPKDGEFEHAADAVRYLVQHRLPLPDLGVGALDFRPDANTREGWRAT